jgi:uncharacterized protein YcnI
MKSKPLFITAVAASAIVCSSADAHVTLENRPATPASYAKAVFGVPHGCAGSPTVKVRVQIPDGVISVKPMPKPGWSVETVKGKYATSYELHGATITEGVKEVTWSGGKLADDNYDEFVLAIFLTGSLKPNTTVYFPVVQECEQGVSRWIEIPQGDKPAHDMKTPAPGIKLMPKS